MKRSITDSLLRGSLARPKDKPFEITDASLNGFVLRVQPSGVRTFLLRYGRTGRATIGRANEMSADEARTTALKVLANVRDGLPPWTGIRTNETTLGAFIEGDYYQWFKANRSVKTADWTLDRLKHAFPKWWRLPISHLTPEMVERWKAERANEGVGRSTALRELASLSGVYTRAVKTFKVATVHPIRDVEKPKLDRNPKVRFLSDKEESDLRAALSARDAEAIAARERTNQWRIERKRDPLPALKHYADHLTPAVLLSMNTGLRRGELLSLKWSDVDLKERVLTVGGDRAKTGQTRHIPLNSEATEVLEHWLDHAADPDRVFPIATGFKTAFSSLLKAAQIAGFRWHDLRHHFASRLVQAGVPLATVRELGGWKDFEMTLRYAHLAPDQRRAAVEKLGVSRG